MPDPRKTFVNWSGGKDSALALNRALNDPSIEVSCLFTTISEEFQRVSMHGVRRELVQAQADMLGIPLVVVEIPKDGGLEEYGKAINGGIDRLKEEFEVEAGIFGDIYLEDLRSYRENQLSSAGLEAIFPIWKASFDELKDELESEGIEATIVCVDLMKLDADILGEQIDKRFFENLPNSIDHFGEKGEFHSFVGYMSAFDSRVPFSTGKREDHKYTPGGPNALGKDHPGFAFLDLKLNGK